ncbi:SET and MYND domain-containing protein 4-like [Bradysia coprophila]|uniref:SET and MYND domain-containing protein 4-like n=1 Tax=Bradysia coprophila TaxID=38358 RepID=UPI00187DA462|nr:SET and MYND domain-containing protein 4-like [Bradysia coprophila]
MENNLWRREKRFDIFVDLLDPSLPYETVYDSQIEGAKHRFHGKQYEPTKSDQVSALFRAAGNREFKEKKWRVAMEYYNRSLIFAETNSDIVSLAYANRSACFFHMQKYDHCFRDIELAIEHNYPKRLMHKLDDREAECVKHLNEKNVDRELIEPKLSYDPDEKFPCMANVLEIKTNHRFGRYIEAKCDIDVGQTVLVEKGFVHVFEASDRTLCVTCMRHVQNFIPCGGCTDAMFCDETCMKNNDTHRIACGAAFNRIPGNVRYWAESILIAINAFPSVEHLMEFVEDQLTLPKTEMPKNCSDAQMQYGLFLKLDRMGHDKDIYQNMLKYVTYKLLMAIPAIGEKFTTKKKQRFLMHLIWQHKNIADRSAFVQPLADADARNSFDAGSQIIATCNIFGLFNHSCIPNLFNDFVGNKQILITTRPVKKGDQLFVCYEQHLWSKSAVQRREHLKSVYNFNCKCARCKQQFVNDISMQTDPMYLCIEQSRGKTISDARREILKKMCYDFMRKYAHVACANEILVVTVQLMLFLQDDYPEYRKIIT